MFLFHLYFEAEKSIAFKASPKRRRYGNITSSIDLNPWVKDSDAQRAGELIYPVLQAKEDEKITIKVCI